MGVNWLPGCYTEVVRFIIKTYSSMITFLYRSDPAGGYYLYVGGVQTREGSRMESCQREGGMVRWVVAIVNSSRLKDGLLSHTFVPFPWFPRPYTHWNKRESR